MGFSQFLTIMRARRALIMTIVLIVVASVAGVTLLLPKRYQASTSVMVDQKVVYSTAGMGQGGSPGRPGDIITTQTDVLTSPAVALYVVDELKLVDRPDIGSLIADSNVFKRAWWSIRALLTPSEEGPEPDLRYVIADGLLKNLSVKSSRDSFLIRVIYAAPSPEFAAAVADSFARGYLATVESLRAGPAKRDTKEFDERIRALRKDLEEAEVKLADFQQKKGILASDERLDLETGRLNEISAQLAMAQSQSAESQARQRQLREYLGGGRSDAPGEVWASPVVQQLRGSIAEREAKLADMSQRIGPNHPVYQTAATELQKLRGQLSQEMRAAAESAINASTVQPQREGSLRSTLEQQRSKVLKMKNDRNTLAILQREVDSARQSYEAVSQRLTQSRVAGEVGQAIGWVVDAAVVPTRPFSPNAPLNVALALVAGLILGIGMALAFESIDGYVRSERDVVELIEVPVLAILSGRRGERARYLGAPNIRALPRA